MAQKYQDYLAANVLSDGAIVNYRMLSRSLKVHSNAAKDMLQDFYRTQKARKPGSLHATYLLTGTRKPIPASQANGNKSQDVTDSVMSDGLASSSMPEQEEEIEHIPVTSITLVAEEHLEAVKSLYESITCQHIYSLEPGPLSNMQLLSDCNRKVATEHYQDDPLETWKTYGTIHNPDSKRRTNRRPPPPATAPTTSGMKPSSTANSTTAKPPSKSTDTSRPSSRDGSEAPRKPDTKKGFASKPSTLRKESSDLFKSFAKTKPPTAKGSTKTDADAEMKDDSEGEDATALNAEQTEASAEKAAAARREREEKEATLRKMMEDDDEGLDSENVEQDKEDTPMTDAAEDAEQTAEEEEHVDAALDRTHIPTASQQHEHATVSDGRRRGRRRVMKKNMTRDAEGYIVTREELVWESFSEEEPASKRVRVEAPAQARGRGAGGAKRGQGGIMSFFGKRG